MQFCKWILKFGLALVIAGLLLCGLNVVVDPFGVFGDRILKWYSYDMVNNPRVAKIGYLDQYHDNYDSFIIGGSKSSSISPALLNKYYGDASFYSMLMYGGDFHDYEKTLYYIVDHYHPKNIVLHMSLQEIGHYHETRDEIKKSMHAKVMKESQFLFYLKYLTLNPVYAYEKLEAYGKRAIDSFEYSQIIPESGVYNKVRRDAEDLSDLDKYLEANPQFKHGFGKIETVALDKNVESLRRMKEYCEERDISFMMITGATYTLEMKSYNLEDLKEYWAKLASVTDFWDFTGFTPVSDEPRNFYDVMHYRNPIGVMMLGYIFNDPNVEVPTGFGHYTTKDNVAAHAEKVFTKPSEH